MKKLTTHNFITKRVTEKVNKLISTVKSQQKILNILLCNGDSVVKLTPSSFGRYLVMFSYEHDGGFFGNGPLPAMNK